jgi:hypothetical protein
MADDQFPMTNSQSTLQVIAGSVTAPSGFLAAGVFCDIKRLGTGKGSNKGGKRDLALLVSRAPATLAGTFTTNQVRAAPVQLCIQRVQRGTARALVVNSGNANACTGRQGFRDAALMARWTCWSPPPAASASRCRWTTSRRESPKPSRFWIRPWKAAATPPRPS